MSRLDFAITSDVLLKLGRHGGSLGLGSGGDAEASGNDQDRRMVPCTETFVPFWLCLLHRGELGQSIVNEGVASCWVVPLARLSSDAGPAVPDDPRRLGVLFMTQVAGTSASPLEHLLARSVPKLLSSPRLVKPAFAVILKSSQL